MLLSALLALLFCLLAACANESTQQENYPLLYSDEVEHWASNCAVDPYLVYAVIRTESGFDPAAESAAGARGLMQMTEDTFEWIKGKIAPEEALTFDSLYDPDTSIRFGTYFLSLCLSRYEGDISTAAAAYHSGWGTVDALLQEAENTSNGVHLSVFPYSQMAHYVKKINKNYEAYRSLYAATAETAGQSQA